MLSTKMSEDNHKENSRRHKATGGLTSQMDIPKKSGFSLLTTMRCFATGCDD